MKYEGEINPATGKRQFFEAVPGNPGLFDASDYAVGKNAYGLASVHKMVRRTDPSTSKAAARDAQPRTGTQRAHVLELLRAAGPHGLTDEELARAAHPSHPSWSDSGLRTRRRELVDLGYVIDSGKTRRTKRGLESVVWTAPDRARTALPLSTPVGGTTPEDVA